ncbi:Bro-N domain-containing protein [Nitratidesulfovibrio liaohensis]|uniref:Bro-N domain-containing protein n=1 Tax=Nitratidesulfovibrio liaohensis TaxID=2604158 RepID=A0ABY9R0P9_9BACT|nr:Bro-N domain-containing protein [Nitratidesulfovibrio liaohensis]WMW64408.1 Bro-N domain-containing protein [Nitratidesulfovibrio liaohensis]
MEQLAPFVFDDSLVRVHVDADQRPWFVAKDVCRVLDIANHNDALSSLDDDEKDGVGITDPMGRQQTVRTVSESGLYSLVFRSRKPEARRFRKWVTADVLPSLRRTGRYGPEQSAQQPALPDAARRLKPAVRASVLHCAVQVAKMGGGTPQEVDDLYLRYCAMVATPYEAGTPPALQQAALAGADAAQARQLVRQWAQDRGLWPVRRRTARKVQCARLYDDFTAWCAGQGTQVGLRAFGTAMRTLFRVHASNKTWYFVNMDTG